MPASTTSSRLILVVSVALTLLFNVAFFRNIFEVYGSSLHELGFIASTAVLLTALEVFLLSLVSHRHTVKPIIILLLVSGAIASYFMNSYNVVIDSVMLRNVAETNADEATDLVSVGAIVYLLVLGVIPSWLVYRTRILDRGWKCEALSRLKLTGGSLSIVVVLLLGFGGNYATFFHEHKVLRYYTNPLALVWSSGVFLKEELVPQHTGPREQIGLDAHLADPAEKDLVVLVLGETARADHFSLNGYVRDTNRELSKYDVLSFRQVQSCGTSTAYSVPCMFSLIDADHFDIESARNSENVLDVIQRAGVHVLWRDNNSDSKGVAAAIEYQDFKDPKQNPVCDIECRDEGMLAGLDDYLDSVGDGSVLIVLHQMGNHGPAYYKRYPEGFARYQPVCTTNEIQSCTPEEINNAYDNAIAYTDHFLAGTIEFLKQHAGDYNTALFYVSDHGESLGENGVYLHGLPKMIAPEAQVHVPFLVWLGKGFEDRRNGLVAELGDRLSHDNLFHTMLGLLHVDTNVYDVKRDLFADCQHVSSVACGNLASIAQH